MVAEVRFHGKGRVLWLGHVSTWIEVMAAPKDRYELEVGSGRGCWAVGAGSLAGPVPDVG